MRRACFSVAFGLLASVLHADVVTFSQYVSLGGERSLIREPQSVVTRETVSSVTAPSRSGWIFTHWSTDNLQDLANREPNGRAKDRVSVTIYENTVLVANYLSTGADSDADGVADGKELYWYGHLNCDAESDTDGDHYTLAEELSEGTDPLSAESHPTWWFDTNVDGAVVCATSGEITYNPYSISPYVIRSEPEGRLFATISDYEKAGTVLTTDSYSPKNSQFAYWMVDGVPQRESDGRSKAQVSFTVSSKGVEVVAVCIEDSDMRQQMYWYGKADVGMGSDTDGDHYTLAEELSEGTDPLSAESHPTWWFDTNVDGAVVCATSGAITYNPNSISPYVIRSEPEGRLFATVSGYEKIGTVLTTDSYSPKNSQFAYWTVDGVPQCEADGRAKERVSFTVLSEGVEVVAVCIEDSDTRQQMYWYGDADVGMDSDTDGDHYTLVEELSEGTDPLSAESHPTWWFDTNVDGAVVIATSGEISYNLQPYEQLRGAIVGGRYVEMFTSKIAGNGSTSETFGSNLQPVVVDVNGDGLWDIVLVYEGGEKALVNVGGEGNPEFEERQVNLSGVDVEMNSTAKLSGMTLDVRPIAALSATTWGESVLLVSDEGGRIWYYEDGVLQHKVWGGSFAGFANGLRIAAVDWDDDGDLDCLAGTAEGKLMLLRDPKVGRPTNLKALVGVDNVKLDWDPNQQSRIRGYKVYRADAEGEDFTSLVSPYTPLPTYRDYPPSVSDFDYKVSSVSRHYTAGNSTPIESESPATEAVRASLGKVSLHWTDAVAKRGETFSLMLSIDNSANLSPEGMAVEIEYDHAVLNLLKTLPSGLFEGDKIAPGSGKLYEYVFEVLGEGAGETTVSVKSATMYGIGGGKVTVALPVKNATVTIAARQEFAPYRLGDIDGDGKVDEIDLRLLVRLKSAAGRKWTANQLKAGDFNGNGKLDDADYQALWAMLKEPGAID